MDMGTLFFWHCRDRNGSVQRALDRLPQALPRPLPRPRPAAGAAGPGGAPPRPRPRPTAGAGGPGRAPPRPRPRPAGGAAGAGGAGGTAPRPRPRPRAAPAAGAGGAGGAGRRCAARALKAARVEFQAPCKVSSSRNSSWRCRHLASIILVRCSAGTSRANAVSACISSPRWNTCASGAAGSTEQLNRKTSRCSYWLSRRSSVCAAVLSGSAGTAIPPRVCRTSAMLKRTWFMPRVSLCTLLIRPRACPQRKPQPSCAPGPLPRSSDPLSLPGSCSRRCRGSQRVCMTACT